MQPEITRIANPIYDGAFKYLLDDNKVARIFLSILLGEEVVDLQLRPTEHCTDIEQRCITVFRIDFAAKIRSAGGMEKLVIIEIQKAKYATDIMRFRKYLGQQYASDNNVHEEPPEAPRALPIFSIYLLGHRLDHIREPVIRVTREYRDIQGRTLEGPREDFIESLTHDSIVVQIPLLKPSRQNDIERLLGLFDQSQADPGNAHVLSIVDEDYPEKFQPVIRRLMKAVMEPAVRNTMQVEDEYLGELENLERAIAKREDIIATKDDVIATKDDVIAKKDDVIAKKDDVIAGKDDVIAGKDDVIAEKDDVIAEKEQALQQTKTQLDRAVQILVSQGLNEEEARRMIFGN
jgi:uncharacterized coiled-coil protein SlyX